MNYVIIGVLAGAGLLMWIVGSINQMRSDISRININLNKIAKQIGVPNTINDEIKNLILEGKKVEAIKKYRNATGIGLKESKEYIDSLIK
ncbi:50S ribosomal protein L7/L12 [Clostridium botulinum]|uniref:50S ribosomal protein L7/L12 n=1 Tax=unclassified Clostridium TaxID=2614128 RepID=UPI0005086E69|nr:MULTISPECIES: 50S ribosomal protein L7/L12 [unclassified Clostridium]KFX54906.1 50S ribosomal protein L7/L12 [Clostridium botulinum]KFX57285.1 50S ribosomal protein L7/L12 [Clostridium botulinum]MBY6777415.1 50S ribosomal protein L7/L12 [Clostridium botulinum]MBY6802576.1 50S ribosomal protein L7/L12 [Clostridium botulinum]MBY6812695.1 50S ribosomal protein L7/L12 [Clostridium botulinum]